MAKKQTWREKLTKIAKEEKEYSKELTDLAESWETCYVGEKFNELTERGFKFFYTQPENAELNMLGCNFTHHVLSGHWEAAKITADQIDYLTP